MEFGLFMANMKSRLWNWLRPPEQINTEKKLVESRVKETPWVNHVNGRCKVNTNNIYYYYTNRSKCYFKTPRGRRPIKLTASEGLRIITLKKRGFSIDEIYDAYAWYYDVNVSTLKNWLDKYNLGLMDIALDWIITNDIECQGKSPTQYLHKYVGDL